VVATTGSDTATVTVTAVNNPPVANNDVYQVTKSTSNTLQVRTNDTDPNGNPLTITAVTQPAAGRGSVYVGPGGTYLIYNAPSTIGTASFSYTLSDGAGGVDTATVSITVVHGEACVPNPFTGECEIPPW